MSSLARSISHACPVAAMVHRRGGPARRGRREKPWPPAKQKKLLRLYVCTQSERLPLVRILERLKDGAFDPRQRNSHKHLKSLLPDRRIDDWRPRDLSTMLIRVRFLRSVMAERRKRRRRLRDGSTESPHSLSFSLMDGHTGTCGSGLAVVSPEQYPPAYTNTTAIGKTTAAAGDHHTHHHHTEPESSTSPVVKAESTATPDSFPRANSISRSTTSPSTKSASKRRSWASVLSSISSGISSLARSTSSASSKGISVNEASASVTLSRLSREDFLSLLEEKLPNNSNNSSGNNNNNNNNNNKSKNSKPTLKTPSIFQRNKHADPPSGPTTEELNAALVSMCCSTAIATAGRSSSTSGPGGCVHERLSRAIDDQRTEGPAFRDFWVTETEVNAADRFGNTLLHVAARWGARVSILILLLRYTHDVQMTNHRGETFLHLYDPPPSPRLRPASFLNLVRCLRSRGFDFCQRDVDKQTFLHCLVARRNFPVEILHCVFREVARGTARFLVASKSGREERLWHCVRKNLVQQSPKLHRVFGDEVEFSRSSSRDATTPASEVPSWAQGCHRRTVPAADRDSESVGSGEELDASSGQRVKRTALMELLRKVATGRDSSDRDLEARMESIVGAKTPTPELTALLDARDAEGNTALHYAGEFGIVAAVRFLCVNGAQVSVFNNCGNTALQLVKYAIQRTDVTSDVHMEARYLRCAVLLLERGAIDQTKLVSERSVIYPYDVFDGSERCIANLENQGVANRCRGLHLLPPSPTHPGGHGHHHHGHGRDGGDADGSMSVRAMSLEFHTSAI
ncbi:hypothetical protein B0T22DRAFT_531406 [Podospora appendiculata]|uniref:Ankyrin repeat protein n=1 Tax=Podospora appendiculata TaxID=314037 RepID=A0AAE0WYT9_9PEZI|nr:hypothetical protein B0T22DRAFT_531406 [Podospora appendiculata]